MFQKKWSVQILQNWSFVLGPIPGYKLLCHPPPLPLLIQGSDVPGASWRCVVVLRTICWETNHRKAMGFQSLDKVMTQWPPNIVFVSLKAPSTFVVSRISPKPNVNQVISEAIILGTCRCFLYMFPWILGMKTPDDSCRLKLLWFCNNINLASDPHQEKRWETLVGSSGFCILLFGLAWLDTGSPSASILSSWCHKPHYSTQKLHHNSSWGRHFLGCASKNAFCKLLMYTTTIACQRDVESKKHLLGLSENRLSKINLAITINPTKTDKAVSLWYAPFSNRPI